MRVVPRWMPSVAFLCLMGMNLGSSLTSMASSRSRTLVLARSALTRRWLPVGTTRRRPWSSSCRNKQNTGHLRRAVPGYGKSRECLIHGRGMANTRGLRFLRRGGFAAPFISIQQSSSFPIYRLQYQIVFIPSVVSTVVRLTGRRRAVPALRWVRRALPTQVVLALHADIPVQAQLTALNCVAIVLEEGIFSI